VASTRKDWVVCRVWVGPPKGKDHLENLGVDGTIRMKLVFKNYHVNWPGLICLRIETGGELL
jgi:hypothetical protein